jgi:hypothetical protein
VGDGTPRLSAEFGGGSPPSMLKRTSFLQRVLLLSDRAVLTSHRLGSVRWCGVANVRPGSWDMRPLGSPSAGAFVLITQGGANERGVAFSASSIMSMIEA